MWPHRPCGAITVPIYETDLPPRRRISSKTPTCASSSRRPPSRPSSVELCVPRASRFSYPLLDRGAERVLTGAAQGVTVEQVREHRRAVKPADEATIIYTSGTTGMPMPSSPHGNFISADAAGL